LKTFQPILASARDRDVNEADTVIIVTDMLASVFGYDKYTEISREHVIRGTFSDLAINVDGKLRFIIEVKAVGIDLRELHVKQAVDYAVNQGIDWAILTNGVVWQVYKVTYSKPIEKELILEMDLLNLSAKNDSDIESLFLLAKEGLDRSALSEYQTQLNATNRFVLAALIQTEPVLTVIRREVRRIAPDVKLSIEDVSQALTKDLFKRDVIEGEQAEKARKIVQKMAKKRLRLSEQKAEGEKAQEECGVEEPKADEPTADDDISNP
jgi:hypothetical protein